MLVRALEKEVELNPVVRVNPDSEIFDKLRDMFQPVLASLNGLEELGASTQVQVHQYCLDDARKNLASQAAHSEFSLSELRMRAKAHYLALAQKS